MACPIFSCSLSLSPFISSIFPQSHNTCRYNVFQYFYYVHHPIRPHPHVPTRALYLVAMHFHNVNALINSNTYIDIPFLTNNCFPFIKPIGNHSNSNSALHVRCGLLNNTLRYRDEINIGTFCQHANIFPHSE